MIQGRWKKFVIPDNVLRKLISPYSYEYEYEYAEHNKIKYKKSGDDFVLRLYEYLEVRRINGVYKFYTKDHYGSAFREYDPLEKHDCSYTSQWKFWTLHHFMGEFFVSHNGKPKKLTYYNIDIGMSCELENENGSKGRCHPSSIKAILPVQSFEELKLAVKNKWSKNAREHNLKDCLGQPVEVGSYIFYANQNNHYLGIVGGFRTITNRQSQKKVEIIRLDLVGSSSGRKGLKIYELKSDQKFIVLDSEHAFRLSLTI